MTVLYALLLTAALLCFLAAAFATRSDFAGDFSNRARVNLTALGLAFWVAVPFIQMWKAVD